jgi:hypothetical protein
MVHFSLFGGHEGQLNPGRCVYICVFGGASLKRSPVAMRLVARHQPGENSRSGWQHFFFNLFGGTTIKWPTLAEEFLALMDALRARTLTMEDWDRGAGQASDLLGLRAASFSMFGGMETDALPSEDQELDELSLQRHTGLIPEPALERLMLAIGHSGAQRLAAVRQAAGVALALTTPQGAARS